jgi:hypothetical protein
MDATNLIPAAVGVVVALVMNVNGWWLNDGTRVGPGTIFPIVIAVGATMAAVTIAIGAAPALLRR